MQLHEVLLARLKKRQALFFIIRVSKWIFRYFQNLEKYYLKKNFLTLLRQLAESTFSKENFAALTENIQPKIGCLITVGRNLLNDFFIEVYEKYKLDYIYIIFVKKF